MRAKYNKGGRTALYDLMKKYEHGGVHPEGGPKGRKFSEYHTGATFEKHPQIDIEHKKVMTGKDQDGNPIYENEPQFFIEGKPVSSEDAMRFYDMSQEGVQGAKSFNDFVADYTRQYFTEASGGATARGPQQTRSRVAKKKEAGVKGLLEALDYYKEAPSNMRFEE